ncbi:hypothetical protein GCM10009864_62080 [Streptomyces lunalinharesii]|uniref:Uncharacterized protein n=1 Tax=Streptomyces lunalinharesii TaxID=333384 RepID=A0ABN3SPN2_9ACTN
MAPPVPPTGPAPRGARATVAVPPHVSCCPPTGGSSVPGRAPARAVVRAPQRARLRCAYASGSPSLPVCRGRRGTEVLRGQLSRPSWRDGESTTRHMDRQPACRPIARPIPGGGTGLARTLGATTAVFEEDSDTALFTLEPATADPREAGAPLWACVNGDRGQQPWARTA